MSSTNRRDFLKSAAAVGGTLGLSGLVAAEQGANGGEDGQAPDKPEPGMPRRKLGRIDAQVSLLGCGLGSAFTGPNRNDPDKAHRLLETALDLGVNYFDTARAYGPSEKLIGPVVKKHRDRMFLVSKSGRRDYDGFQRELEQSLENLQTNRIDLYHIHDLGGRDRDLAAIEKGAVKAARKARDEGTIGAFGVTGHSGAAILIQAMKAWEPDAVLTVFSASRPDRGRYEDELLPLARQKKMGVIAMKTVRHARDADLEGSDLVRYALSLEGVATAIVGLDNAMHLKANAKMASNFTPIDAQGRARMAEQVQLALAGLAPQWERPGYNDTCEV